MKDGFDGKLMNATESDDGATTAAQAKPMASAGSRAARPSRPALNNPQEPKSPGYREILRGFQWVENVEKYSSRQ